MAKQNRTILKGYFETGDIPTQAHFIDLIDSSINMSENNTGNIQLTGHITASGNISGSATSTFTGNSSSFGSVAGTLSTAAQPNVTSLGSLTSVTTTGNSTLGDASSDTHTFTGNITASGDISGSSTSVFTSKSGSFGTIDTTHVNSTNVVGTLQTAAQTNITSVGTLDSLTVTGNITANGNIVGDDETDITNIETIECDNIVHDGDTDTKISFTTDQIDFVAGGATFLRLDEQGSTDTITFNTSNSDIDFVVNADGQSNIINVVGSNGYVGINRATPTAQLHVYGTVLLENLPTSDPSVEGQLYNDSGTIKISAG